MSWQLVDAPSHIAPEVGANLLAGDGPWTAPLALDGEYVLTVEVLGGGVVEWVVTGVDGEGLPVTVPGLSETVPDGEWVRVTIPFTAPGFVGDAAVSLTVPGESRDPVLGELTGRTVLTVPGDVLAETIMASGGIIAGTPGGARVELTEDGLHAFDATGVETANIQGEGGEFVGGSFRTSDALPGQVVLADDAVDNDFNGGTLGPGIRVTPTDTSDMVYPASIGPSTQGLTIYGGRRTTGGRSIVQCNPDGSFLRTFHEGGMEAGIVQTSPASSFMRTYREDGTVGGSIQTSPAESFMRTYREDGERGGTIQTSPASSFMRTFHPGGATAGDIQTTPAASYMRTYREDGTTIAGSIQTSGNGSFMQTYGENGGIGNIETNATSATVRTIDANGFNRARITASDNTVTLFSATNGQRYLELNETGIWIRTGPSGNQKVYNLEETAQDSGWQSFPVRSGITPSASLAWRNKGGIIWWRGTVTASWSAGWNTIVTGMPDETIPEYAYTVNEAGTTGGVLIRMQSNGALELYAPAAGTSTHRLTSLSYPVG